MPDPSADQQMIERALELARQGTGLASPNPYVGAVIADSEGNIAGAGTYTYAVVKHAEILALEQAGPRARGGTLYINLEPHAHKGRTPPCTDALIAARIRRVVASMPDPNPKVSGRGFDQLRAAGVQVEVGALEEPARRLNEAFARYIRSGTPFVTLKSAMTLDGKIGPPPAAAGQPTPDRWISGASARTRVHKLRHENDALITGIGTVLADDPLLTDRSGLPRRRLLQRVVLDSQLRLPHESRLVQSAKNDLLVFTVSTDAAKITALERAGVRVEKSSVDGVGQRLDLNGVLRRLAELEITSAMIEAGTAVNSAALAANIVDKLFLFYGSTIFGDQNSVPFANAPAAPRVRRPHFHRFGDDIAIEGYLRDPYDD